MHVFDDVIVLFLPSSSYLLLLLYNLPSELSMTLLRLPYAMNLQGREYRIRRSSKKYAGLPFDVVHKGNLVVRIVKILTFSLIVKKLT